MRLGTPGLYLGLSLLLVAGASPAFSVDAPAKKIELKKLSDLPPHTYVIPGKPSAFVQDPAAVRILAAAVGKDLQKDLDTYDIQDKTTLKRFHGTLAIIAMLEGKEAEVRAHLATVKGLEDKPAQKLMSGLMLGAYLDAKANPGGDFKAAFRKALDKALAALPYQEVQDAIKGQKAAMEIGSANLITGQIAASLDPVITDGKISQDLGGGLLGAAFQLETILPVKAEIVASLTAVLDANRTARKADIWAGRDEALKASASLHPVVIGIWDSGTDVALFKDRLWVNRKEVPGNAKDDDRNGFVDDVNGIAWDLHSNKVVGPLATLEGKPEKIQAAKASLKGFVDLQANVDSPEAGALKKLLSTLPAAEVKDFIEGVSQVSNYSHGTHVSGIAAKGNPAARLLVDRITFDYHVHPETPTLEQAAKDAAAMVQSVAYFKAHGVRVVNMSWGGDLKSIDHALELNHAGGTPEERRLLAKKIYDIGYKALDKAITAAPGVLFVVAAGNSNNDVKFDEVFPSSFRKPNVLIVGAVDQAGDQTSFTSFGNVDVFANGFEVESCVPGGELMKFSGTSMAAPNVTNLAGKLLALKPALGTQAVKDLIIKGAEEKVVAGKTIRLIHPARTLELARH
ncbi:S8 family serine peptidase [Mesoterricola silvestris]|uniref:Peptidase S8/S53 domain-containing protein n=1 Tax=Mesoterricola silvestris TaxID=2927979 RepID=A0AA48GR25_9BACT|nr:S8 family serine peptidase [Mesoterricola silvestris]BDU72660.1 hypothetical protein METEAL_18340 [Mesoterricola silvestris]